MTMKIVALALCCSLTMGCATASFAPPSTSLVYELEAAGSDSSLTARCKPTPKTKDNSLSKNPVDFVRILPTAAGSQKLIDNFIFTYRCRAHSAANGRQGFEIPSLLIAAGAATALALGAPSEVAIGGGAATSVLGSGKNYYAPQAKAEIFDSALDALLCIKNESNGIDAISIDTISTTEKGGAKGLYDQANNLITISAGERYYSAISAALLSVERVLAKRLSVVGTFDSAGVVAEIKALTKEAEKVEAESMKSAMEQAKAVLSNGSRGDDGAREAAKSTTAAKVAETIVKLDILQPKLQQCVVRAKI